jgi:hypothetical protein
MKQTLTTFLFVLLAGAALPAQAMPLVNGDFETGVLAPWVNGIDASNPFNVNAPWSVSADAAHTGSFGATVIDNFEMRQDFAAVATADITSLSFWARTPLEPFGAFVLLTLVYDNGFEDFYPAITDTADWTFFDVTSFLQPGLSLSGLTFFGFTSAGVPVNRADLDDVVLITTVPEPAALSLAGLGLAALGWRRRRGGLAV